MRILPLVLAGLLLSRPALAAPPAAVRAAFAKHFAFVKKARWEAEDNAYEAHFRINGVAHSAVFTATGQLTETEEQMPLSALPADAVAYLAVHYPGQVVKEAARIVDPIGRVTWEAEVKHRDVLFDEKGQFLRDAQP